MLAAFVWFRNRYCGNGTFNLNCSISGQSLYKIGYIFNIVIFCIWKAWFYKHQMFSEVQNTLCKELQVWALFLLSSNFTTRFVGLIMKGCMTTIRCNEFSLYLEKWNVKVWWNFYNIFRLNYIINKAKQLIIDICLVEIYFNLGFNCSLYNYNNLFYILKFTYSYLLYVWFLYH